MPQRRPRLFSGPETERYACSSGLLSSHMSNPPRDKILLTRRCLQAFS